MIPVDWLSLVLILVCCALAVFGVTTWVSGGARAGSDKPLPPLVPGIPLLGNVFQVDRSSPHTTLTEWVRSHGHVYRFRVFGQDTVVLNSRAAIRETALRGNQLAGRPYIFRIKHGFHGADDVIFGDFTAKWSFMKSVVSKALKPYGSNNAGVEGIVCEEMEKLVAVMASHQGRAFDPAITVLTAVVNAMSATIVGTRYEHDSEKMRRYKTTTRLFSEACSVVEGMELDMVPWLRFLPNKSFAKLTKAIDMLDSLIDDELTDAKERFDRVTPRCIIDELLMKMSSPEVDGATWTLTETDLRSIFIDLIVGGTLTTSIAVYAFILTLMHHPAEQKRVQAEVDAVLGPGTLPSVKARAEMPYTEACTCELLRLISHVPLSLPHQAVDHTHVAGYHIPKHTQVLLNLWALHHDPAFWEDPWAFKPDRFLDSEGKLLPPAHERMKSFLPFGLGRRVCLGEMLARERLFLFAACLLQSFTILPPEDVKVTSFDPREYQLGLILEPPPFQARFEAR